VELCPGLTSLTLSTGRYFRAPALDIAMLLHLPALQHLSISEDLRLKGLKSICTTLVDIDVLGCELEEGDGTFLHNLHLVSVKFRECQGLNILTFVGCQRLEEVQVHDIADARNMTVHNCPRLHTLDVKGSYHGNKGEGVIKLSLTACPRLRDLTAVTVLGSLDITSMALLEKLTLEGDVANWGGMASGANASSPADFSCLCVPAVRILKMKADHFSARLTIACPLLEELRIELGQALKRKGLNPLTFVGCQRPEEVPAHAFDNALNVTVYSCPHLHTLHVNGRHPMKKGKEIMLSITACLQLHTLDVNRTYHGKKGEGEMKFSITACPRLRDLKAMRVLVSMDVMSMAMLEKLTLEGDVANYDGMSSGASASSPPDVSYFCFPALRTLRISSNEFPTRLTIDCPLLQELRLEVEFEGSTYNDVTGLMDESKVEKIRLLDLLCSRLKSFYINWKCVHPLPLEWILSVIANNSMLSTTSEGRQSLKRFEWCIQEADRAAYLCALPMLTEEV